MCMVVVKLLLIILVLIQLMLLVVRWTLITMNSKYMILLMVLVVVTGYRHIYGFGADTTNGTFLYIKVVLNWWQVIILIVQSNNLFLLGVMMRCFWTDKNVWNLDRITLELV